MKKILLMLLLLLVVPVAYAEIEYTDNLDKPISWWGSLFSMGALVQPSSGCTLMTTGKSSCKAFPETSKLESTTNTATMQVQWAYRAYTDSSCSNVYQTVKSDIYWGNGNTGTLTPPYSGKYYNIIYEKYDCGGTTTTTPTTTTTKLCWYIDIDNICKSTDYSGSCVDVGLWNTKTDCENANKCPIGSYTSQAGIEVIGCYLDSHCPTDMKCGLLLPDGCEVCIQKPIGCLDMDTDGFDTNCGVIDCNDADNTIYPLAKEICDSKDNDCDGQIDEGCVTPPPVAEKVCCNTGTVLVPTYTLQDSCALISQVTIENCGVVPPTTLIKGILAEKLEYLTRTELEASACKKTEQCEPLANCLSFYALPPTVQSTLSKGFFNIAEEGLCMIGTPQNITQPPSTGKVLSISLPFQDWKETSIGQRLKTLCIDNSDCSPYENLIDSSKEYAVECKDVSQIRGQLEEDVTKICSPKESAGKTYAVGGGATGFIAGCGVGAGLGGGTTFFLGGIGALPGCIVGGITATVIGATIGSTIGTTIYVNCQEKTVPSNVGACIAFEEGKSTSMEGLDLCSWTESWAPKWFGNQCSTGWGIVIIAFIVLVFILPLLSPKK